MFGAAPKPEEFAGMAFAEGVVVGARSFEVTDGGLLTGCTYRQPWTVGENLAVCFAQTGWSTHDQIQEAKPSEPHPITSCKHGFYAYYDGSNDFRQDRRVSGVIQGYGETLIGSRGFRCMKARILALTINQGVSHRLLTLVQNRYRGIQFFPSFEVMVLAFPPDTGETRSTKQQEVEQ